MASNYLAKGLKRSALTVALGLCFIGGVQAQTNTAGAITGRAAAGDTITVTNPATGFTRTLTADANGSYRFSQLSTGQYQVSRNGEAPRTVTVNVGGAATVDFVGAGAAGATELGAVTVQGTGAINPIDTSTVESTTILTAQQIARIPVPRNATSVALLAPGTVRGDAAFGNLASFGGSSVAENQYYLNGFNITNTFQNLNFVQVPFEGIAEQQVKTGGYGAEFGRSTGGVLNQITKRGTNEFHAGGNFFYSPGSLQGTRHNYYYPDGTLRADRSENESSEWTAALWASGALVQDKLFAYALIQYGRSQADAYPGITGGTNSHTGTNRPNWLLKLDWNINDNNILEFTALSDKRNTTTDYYDTNIDANGHPSRSATYMGTDHFNGGGDIYVLKYTGYLTDTFTLTALAGTGRFRRHNYSVSAGGIVSEYTGNVGGAVAGCPLVIDGRSLADQNATGGARNGCSLASTVGRVDAGDRRNQFRIDAEWQLGDHLLRGGVDIDDFRSVAGESYSGGVYWRYINNTTVRMRRFMSGSAVEVKQRAFYIEDSWSITDNFLAYIGLRWDTFKNYNGNGQAYVEIKNQFAPRLGFSWDVFGDASFKVFGNAGRYALPLTATVAVRGASVSLYEEEYFTYTGVATDGTDAPTGLTAIPGTHRYLNNEFGVAKDPRTIASTTLKPMYQDEFILGFQAQLNEHVSLGMRAIYRNLKAAIDDTCDYRPILQWAVDHGFSIADGAFQTPADRSAPNEVAVYNPGFPFCRLYNPGEDNTYLMDVNGDGTLETIHFGANDTWQAGNVMGMPVGMSIQGPRGKRTYSAMELFFQGNWDRFFLQGSYTYAQSKGNTEGGVKSDIGQDDTGTTQDFDYPELMIGAYGYLPNDRRHTLKLFGNYEFTDEWSAGFNLLVQSGRPVNCFGYYGNRFESGYGNSYFSCDLGMPNALRDNGKTIIPRGTAGRTPWQRTLDLNVAYKPNWAHGLQFKLDVFNVFNTQTTVTVSETGEDTVGRPTQGPNCGGTGQAQCTYKMTTGYTAPRSVRFMIQYDF